MCSNQLDFGFNYKIWKSLVKIQHLKERDTSRYIYYYYYLLLLL